MSTEAETPVQEPEQPLAETPKESTEVKGSKKKEKKAKKPPRTSMEGMIFNANKVLDQALKPGIKGLPKNLFDECLGIVLISIAEGGFIFSVNVGTGIAMTKNDDGSWSAPCAVGLTGVGFGLLAGASVKDVFMFLMDEQTVEAVTGENGLKVGSQLELTVGIGRTAKGDFDFTGRGVGVPISIAYTKGLFGGFNLEGAVVGVRHNVNEKFYGKTCTAREILTEKSITVPDGKETMLPQVYEKLTKCEEAASEPVDLTPAPAKEEDKKEDAPADAGEKASAKEDAPAKEGDAAAASADSK